jgi:hypothetical protein
VKELLQAIAANEMTGTATPKNAQLRHVEYHDFAA